MKWSRTITTEVRVTPWWVVEGLPEWEGRGVRAVRIWVQTDGRFWFQCHEWEKSGGNGERYADEWIPSTRAWPKNSKEPEPGEEPPP